jgi:hypothetical protein
MLTAPLQSEVILAGTFQIQGTCDIGTLTEFLAPPFPVAPGFPPSPFPHGNVATSRLIHTDQPWEVRLNWKVGGILAHAIDPNFKWQIEVYLEQMGGREFSFPVGVGTTNLTYGSGTPVGAATALAIVYPGTESTTVSIPAGIVPSSIYEVVVALRLLEADGRTPCFLAAFAEFGKVDFYDGH